MLVIAFAAINGTFNTQASLSNQFFKPFGFSNGQVAAIGGGQILVGIIGAFIMGLYIKKTQNYRRALTAMGGLSFLAMVGLLAELAWLPQPNLPVVLATCSVLGFCMIALVPLVLDFTCLQMKPIG
jgi:FLVCR family MFS transporter 7